MNSLAATADYFYYVNFQQLGALQQTGGMPTRTVSIQLSGLTEAEENDIVELARLNAEFMAVLQRGDVADATELLVLHRRSLLVVFLHQCLQYQADALPEHYLAVMRELAASEVVGEIKEILLQWMERYSTSRQGEKVIYACCHQFFANDRDYSAKLETIFSKLAFVHRERSELAVGYADLLAMIVAGNVLGAKEWCRAHGLSAERARRIIYPWMELAMQTPGSAQFFGSCLDLVKACHLEDENLAALLKSAINCRNICDWPVLPRLLVNRQVLAHASPQLAAAQDTKESCFEEAVRFVYTGELRAAPKDLKKLAIFAHRHAIVTLTRKIQETIKAEKQGQLALAHELYDLLGEADSSWHALLQSVICNEIKRCNAQNIHTITLPYGRFLTRLDLACLPAKLRLKDIVAHFPNVSEVILTSKSSLALYTDLHQLAKLESLVIPETIVEAPDFKIIELAQIENLCKLTIKQTEMVRKFAKTDTIIANMFPNVRRFEALLVRLRHLVLHPEWSPGVKCKFRTLYLCENLEHLDIRGCSLDNLVEIFRGPLSKLVALRLLLSKEANNVAPLFAFKELPALEQLVLEGPVGLEIFDAIAYPKLRSLKVTSSSKEHDGSQPQVCFSELFKRCPDLQELQFNGLTYTRS